MITTLTSFRMPRTILRDTAAGSLGKTGSPIGKIHSSPDPRVALR